MAETHKITDRELNARNRPGRQRHPAAEAFEARERAEQEAGGAGGTAGVEAQTVQVEIPPIRVQPQATPAAQAPVPQAPPVAVAAPVAAPVEDDRVRKLTEDLAAAQRALEERTLRELEVSNELQARQSRLAELERDIEARSATATQLQQRLAEVEAQAKEFRQRETQTSVEQMLQSTLYNLGEDSDISPEQVRALNERVLKPVLTQMAAQMRAQEESVAERIARETKAASAPLAEQLEMLRKADREREERAATVRRNEINREILSAFPDFDQFSKSTKFAEFGQKTPPFSLDNNQTLMIRAYQAGNVGIVKDLLKAFKSESAGSDPAAFAEIAGNTSMADVANQPAPVKQEKTYTYGYMQDLREQFQRKEITREDYRKGLAEFERAEKEGRVQG